MAFKMKQSPAKGKLGDFFKGVGKKITEGRQKRVDKQLESKKGTEYEGMTSMEAARAEKKSRKPGESKFQADSRRMGEKKRADKKREAENKADAEYYVGDAEDEVAEKTTKTKIYKAGEPDPGDDAMHNTLTADGTKIYNARTNSYQDYSGELLPELTKEMIVASGVKKRGYKKKRKK